MRGAHGSEIAPATKPQLNGTLVKALARAWRWQRMRDEAFMPPPAIGDAENISKSYISRILRLALLAPDAAAIQELPLSRPKHLKVDPVVTPWLCRRRPMTPSEPYAAGPSGRRSMACRAALRYARADLMADAGSL
jgi:hypothetical protein